MKNIKEKHPLAIRWAHWVNFPILMIMIWSGMLIYWANDEYVVKLFGHTFFHFFPDGFYDFFGIPSRLAEGMAFHFFFMWFFAINGFLYILYTIISGEWKQLVPNRRSFKEAWLVLLHDLHIRKGIPPQDKYNAAQRIAYTSIIIMGLGSVITGLAIYKPVQFYWVTWICGGYHFARILHFILTIGYVLFFIIHVIQVILAGWNNFRSVISGFEVIKDKPNLVFETAGTAAPIVEMIGNKQGSTIEHTRDETPIVKVIEVNKQSTIETPVDKESIPEVIEDKQNSATETTSDEEPV